MMVCPWNLRRVPVFAGQHDTHINTGEDYDTRSLGDIFAMPPGGSSKGKGLAFIPSEWIGHDARCHTVQRGHGSFVALTGDIDTGNHSLVQVAALVRAFAWDAAWLVYSSPHARPGDMRWRVILPLDQPAAFAFWHDAQVVFFDFMETHGVAMDRALARAGQPVFLPNVPPTHHKSCETLRGSDGLPLYYQRDTTGTDVPGLHTDSPPLVQGLAVLAEKREADDRKRQRLRAMAGRRHATHAYGGKESPIASFNRANAVAELLAGYGYEQSPRSDCDWRSPLQTGVTFATRIMGDKWVSLSGSDAAAGLGARCATGCFGDAFDLFVHFEHGGNYRAALRQLHQERKDTLAYAKFGRPANYEGAR
jgi:hypothetical protein